MRITKRQIAELCAESYIRGYNEAIATLRDTQDMISKEQLTEMMVKQFEEKHQND